MTAPLVEPVEDTVRYVVIDGPHAGTIVSADEAQECIRCGSLDAHCPTCLGGYVLGWEHETSRPTGRLELLK